MRGWRNVVELGLSWLMETRGVEPLSRSYRERDYSQMQPDYLRPRDRNPAKHARSVPVYLGRFTGVLAAQARRVTPVGTGTSVRSPMPRPEGQGDALSYCKSRRRCASEYICMYVVGVFNEVAQPPSICIPLVNDLSKPGVPGAMHRICATRVRSFFYLHVRGWRRAYRPFSYDGRARIPF